MSTLEMIDCPFCAEEIKAAAKKCKHCNEFLSTIPANNNASTKQVLTEGDATKFGFFFKSCSGSFSYKPAWWFTFVPLLLLFFAVKAAFILLLPLIIMMNMSVSDWKKKEKAEGRTKFKYGVGKISSSTEV